MTIQKHDVYQDLVYRLINAEVPIIGESGQRPTPELLREVAEAVGGDVTILMTREAASMALGKSLNGHARAMFHRVESGADGLRFYTASIEFVTTIGAFCSGGDECGIAFPAPRRRDWFPWQETIRCRLIR